MTDLRFAYYLVEPVALQDALTYGVRAEEWGFDAVAACENLFWWTPEHAPVWDNFTVLNTVMSRTKHIKIMANVVDPIKRHPAVVTHMTTTMENISPGRMIVGIGPGEIANYGPLVDVSGPKPHRLFTRTKEFITVMKGMWDSTQDNPFNFDGTFFKLKNAFLSNKPSSKRYLPIYLAAMGPKMIRLTGEVADGWTPLTYTPEVYAKDWKVIKDTAKKAGRDIDSIDPGLTIFTTVLKNSERAKTISADRGRLDLAARPPLLQDLGHRQLAKELEDLTWSKREGPITEGVSMANKAHEEAIQKIPEDLTTRVNISGNADEAIAQIEDFIKAGVKFFILWPPYEEENALNETIENYRDKILPYFADIRK